MFQFDEHIFWVVQPPTRKLLRYFANFSCDFNSWGWSFSKFQRCFFICFTFKEAMGFLFQTSGESDDWRGRGFACHLEEEPCCGWWQRGMRDLNGIHLSFVTEFFFPEHFGDPLKIKILHSNERLVSKTCTLYFVKREQNDHPPRKTRLPVIRSACRDWRAPHSHCKGITYIQYTCVYNMASFKTSIFA